MRKDRTKVIDQTDTIVMNISIESESPAKDTGDNGRKNMEDDAETLSACEDETDNVELNIGPTVEIRNKFIQIARLLNLICKFTKYL